MESAVLEAALPTCDAASGGISWDFGLSAALLGPFGACPPFPVEEYRRQRSVDADNCGERPARACQSASQETLANMTTCVLKRATHASMRPLDLGLPQLRQAGDEPRPAEADHPPSRHRHRRRKGAHPELPMQRLEVGLPMVHLCSNQLLTRV